jgi:hypothetical protein
MTPDETEAKLNSMDARIAALEQREDARNSHWLACSRIARIATIVLALLTLASAVGSIFEHRTDPLTQIFGCTMMVALFLSLSFMRATGPVQRQGA